VRFSEWNDKKKNISFVIYTDMPVIFAHKIIELFPVDSTLGKHHLVPLIESVIDYLGIDFWITTFR